VTIRRLTRSKEDWLTICRLVTLLTTLITTRRKSETTKSFVDVALKSNNDLSQQHPTCHYSNQSSSHDTSIHIKSKHLHISPKQLETSTRNPIPSINEISRCVFIFSPNKPNHLHSSHISLALTTKHPLKPCQPYLLGRRVMKMFILLQFIAVFVFIRPDHGALISVFVWQLVEKLA
jgi:hypothetical protein